jgi:hypothetical protein
MTKELQIEKNVPFPESSYGSIANTLRKMDVGDSFFYGNATSVRAVLTRIGTETGFVFTTRKENKGVRVWRTR